MEVFDEGICDDVIPEDWARVERLIRTSGYREGLAAGQDSSIQHGFDEGFSWGTQAAFTVSFLKGIVNALVTNLGRENKGEEETEYKECLKELQALLSELDTLPVKEDSGKDDTASEKPDAGGDIGGASSRAANQGKNTAKNSTESENKDCRNDKNSPCSSSDGSKNAKCSCMNESANNSASQPAQGATAGYRLSGDVANLSLNASASSSSTSLSSSSSSRLEQSKDKSNSKDTTESKASADVASALSNTSLESIQSRLRPLLSRLNCGDVLDTTSHPFLKL